MHRRLLRVGACALFLLPANDVWGKVMFLLASVILSTSRRGGRGGLCVVSRPVWLLGPMFLQGDLCLSSYVPSRVSNSRPMFHPGGLPDKDPLDKNPPGQRPPWTETPGQKPTRQRPLCTVKSGQYASYWNAFLFSL